MRLLALLLAASACATPARRAAQPQAPLVVVSNEGSSDLTLIDASTDEAVATIPVGKRPRGVRASPDGRWVYVALSGSPRAPPGVDESKLPPADRAADGIGVVDVAARRLVRVLPAGQDPEAFDLAADGRLLVVSNEETAEASFVDIASGRITGTVPVGEEPEGVTTHPRGATVWVTSERDHHVTVVDVASRADIARVPTADRPRAIAFTPGGELAFVSAEEGAAVTVIDARAHRAVGQIPLEKPARPMGVAVSPDGGTLYVATGRGGGVVWVDVATREPRRTVRGVGTRPWGIGVTPDGRKLYVACGPSNDVAVLDAATGVVLRRIPAGELPWGIAVIPAP